MEINEAFIQIVGAIVVLLCYTGKYFIMVFKYFSSIMQHIVEDKKIYKIFAIGRKRELKRFYKDNKDIIPINIDIINAVGRAITWRV